MAQSVLETKLETYLSNKLEEKGIFSLHMDSTNKKGFPDRLVFADEIHFVEVKVGKEHGSYYSQTPTQKKWQQMFGFSNAKYILLEGTSQIDEYVNNIKQPKEKPLF